MCLEVLVQLDPTGPKPIGADRLEAVSGLKLRKVKLDGHTAFHVSTDGTCSCGFLSDDAVFDSDRWLFSAGQLQALTKLVEALKSEKVKFRFLAHWLGGERQRSAANVRIAELLADIRGNQIRNNVMYDARA
jgi:hypothetical protein